MEGVNLNNTEALVVQIETKDNIVKKVLIDNGSSIDIFLSHYWERLNISDVALEVCPDGSPLYGFGHNVIVISIVRTMRL